MGPIISRRGRWPPRRPLCNPRRAFLPGGAAMAPNTQAIRFPGASGAPLSARLDGPAESPLAYALFAHCFTCSKESKAATIISAALAERGVAVLRFDFTGLGGSGGDFANTNFSSNVGDLVAAADHLRKHYRAPAILICHSLGGTPPPPAAPACTACTAAATGGLPFHPKHALPPVGDSAPVTKGDRRA